MLLSSATQGVCHLSAAHYCLGRSMGWPGLAAFAQKPDTSMGMCALSWRACGLSPDDVSRLELRACSMLIWRMVSAELLLLMLSLAMRMSSGAQLVSILDSASVTSSVFPPASACLCVGSHVLLVGRQGRRHPKGEEVWGPGLQRQM